MAAKPALRVVRIERTLLERIVAPVEVELPVRAGQPLGPGRARVPGFLLLAFHVDPSLELQDEGGSAIGSEIVSRFVRRYYEIAEGEPDPADSELNALLARIEERAAIPLLPIAEYERVPLLA